MTMSAAVHRLDSESTTRVSLGRQIIAMDPFSVFVDVPAPGDCFEVVLSTSVAPPRGEYVVRCDDGVLARAAVTSSPTDRVGTVRIRFRALLGCLTPRPAARITFDGALVDDRASRSSRQLGVD